jgi:membrane-associated protease RseP (regulator of RpoE activity)
MRLSALKTALLATLLILPTASRVRANGDPDPEPKVKEKKKIVVQAPEKEIVVDEDSIVVSGDFDEPEVPADLRDLDDLPGLAWFHGGGYIGVRPIGMTPELRTHFGAPKDAGVFVGKVEKDSPAAKAGLQVADIVTAADGENIESTRDLVRAVRRKKEGETVKLELVRDRSAKTLTVTVAEREGKEIHLGELGHGKRKFKWRGEHLIPPVPPVPPAPPVSPDLQDRLDDLEKRLDALESRVPQKQNS